MLPFDARFGMSLSPQEWRRIDELFDRALDLPAASRSAFLDLSCGTDSNLRAAVERLLRAHERADSFLAEPAPAFGAPLLHDPQAAAALPGGTRVGAYVIVDAIGRGGMGVVYRARDERLDRDVALKFLPHELGAHPDARQRLIAEARLASALDHVNVGVVHDIGEAADGQLFIAMAYYEGETLAVKLSRGRLPTGEALDLGTQLAAGLAAAHRRHIVHGDVKPENVIVTPDGVAKILDFGIARLAGSEAGGALGTLAYMSPEQRRGDIVDERTDVWSYGMVLREMLTGKLPVTDTGSGSATPVTRVEAVIRSDAVSSGLPQLDAVLQGCLEPDPGDRYPDAGAVLAALGTAVGTQGSDSRRARSRMHAAALALLVGGIVIAGTVRQFSDGGTDPPILAVAGIDEHAGDDTTRVAAAVRDMLATNLARIGQLRVLSNARMYEVLEQLGDTTRSPGAWHGVARQAGATELIEGSLFHTPDRRLRIDLRRVAVHDGAVLRTFTITAPDVFELVDRATADLAAGFGLPRPTLRLADVTTSSFVAYRFYEEGLRQVAVGEVEMAARLFEAALAEDSLFALAAHFLWASRVPQYQYPSAEVRAWLLRLADRAPERERLVMRGAWDSSLSPARHAALADTLIRRYPDLPDGYLMLADNHGSMGDFARALTYVERVLAMDSLALRGSRAACYACQAFAKILTMHMLSDSLAAAQRMARDWTRRQPRSADAWGGLAVTLLLGNRFSEALEAHRVAAELRPGSREATIFPAIVRMHAGDYDGADRLLRELVSEATPATRAEALWQLAISLRQQGRFDEALGVLRHPAATDGGLRPRFRFLQHEALVHFETGRFRDAAAAFDAVAMTRYDPRSVPIEARWASWNLTHAAAARAAAGDTARLAAAADVIEARGTQSSFGRDWRLHHHVRGLLLAARGQHGAAAAAFERAIYSVTQGYTRTNLELARTYIALHRPHDAVAILQPAFRGPLEASNLYVTRTELHALLGRAWEAAGRGDSAAAHYRRVLHAWRAADARLHPRRDSIRARLLALER
jgi:tetratricopeptide (TPR) repeat protein